jgi:hypothetical protein
MAPFSNFSIAFLKRQCFNLGTDTDFCELRLLLTFRFIARWYLGFNIIGRFMSCVLQRCCDVKCSLFNLKYVELILGLPILCVCVELRTSPQEMNMAGIWEQENTRIWAGGGGRFNRRVENSA